MKIVIDIPEDVYIRLKDDEHMIRDVVEKFGGTVSTQANLAILNGTPLPEHGRLIDADELPKHYTKMFSICNHDSWMYVLEERFINEAPTVIEGSKNDTD